MSSTNTSFPRLSSASRAAARASSKLRLWLVFSAGCVMVRGTHAPLVEEKNEASNRPTPSFYAGGTEMSAERFGFWARYKNAGKNRRKQRGTEQTDGGNRRKRRKRRWHKADGG